MSDFEQQWELAHAHAPDLASISQQDGALCPTLLGMYALAWVKGQSKDVAKNWLADTAFKYLVATEAFKPVPLEVKDSIFASLSYAGNWVTHLMSFQVLMHPSRSAVNQWSRIEQGALDYLGYCSNKHVAGLMVELTSCAKYFMSKGVDIDLQLFITRSCAVLNERSAHFVPESKVPAFAIFCPKEWPERAATPLFVAEATQFINANPGQVQFLKGVNASALRRLLATYDMKTLEPFLNQRQLESKLAEDLGL
jgi:hypothetical protein